MRRMLSTTLPTLLLHVLCLVPPAAAQVEVVEYYHHDALGSVRAVTNAAGQVVSQHDYLPFGEEWQAPLTGTPLVQFTGKERDRETGLDYFGARYYRAGIGRFTTVDPGHVGGDIFDPQSWNAYAYARNNPLVYVDPTGTDYFVNVSGGDSFWVDDDAALRRLQVGGFTFAGNVIRNTAGKPVGTFQYFSRFDRVLVEAWRRAAPGVNAALMATAPNYALATTVGAASLGGSGLIALGSRAAPVAGGALTGWSKVDARAALQGVCTTPAQLSSALSSVARATTSTTITIARQGRDVVVQLVRPGANGRQVIESVITPEGGKAVVQKAYDANGALTHYHPK